MIRYALLLGRTIEYWTHRKAVIKTAVYVFDSHIPAREEGILRRDLDEASQEVSNTEQKSEQRSMSLTKHLSTRQQGTLDRDIRSVKSKGALQKHN